MSDEGARRTGSGEARRHAPDGYDRAERDLELARRWVERDPRERRFFRYALAGAVGVHLIVLFARLPAWGPEPVRVDPAPQQAMKVQFLQPPAPPKAEPRPEPPRRKRVPRPDPTPDEPEPEVAPEPPKAEPQAPAVQPQTGPIRVAPGQGPGLIKRVEPVYPAQAQTMRLEGTVVLDAIINKDGTVSEVKVLRSTHPFFARAAEDAIRQWRYTPGPHDVVLTVSVTFTLTR